MTTQHFNAAAELSVLQQQRALAKQRQVSRSVLKRCRGEIVALLKEKSGSYRLVAEWLKRHKHINVSHTTVMRFAKQLPELKETNHAQLS
jgi:hypothetical protein